VECNPSEKNVGYVMAYGYEIKERTKGRPTLYLPCPSQDPGYATAVTSLNILFYFIAHFKQILLHGR